MPTRFVCRCAGVFLLVAAAALSPSSARAQAATASVCKDGTSSAASGRGACSGHGGVDKAATKAAKSTTTGKVAASQVACADGTTSKARRGACSHHGGVMGSATTTAPSSATSPAPPSAPTRVAPASPVARAQVPAQSPAPRTEATSKVPSASGSGKREDNDPTGAIAQCKDGLYSHAKHRRGACSRHGGVAKWTGT